MLGENWQCSLYGLAFTTWGFSFCCLSLHIFKFVPSLLPEMRERNFPFYRCLVPPVSNWSLQVSGEHTTSAEIPEPVLAYEFPAELASILFVSYVLPIKTRCSSVRIRLGMNFQRHASGVGEAMLLKPFLHGLQTDFCLSKHYSLWFFLIFSVT